MGEIVLFYKHDIIIAVKKTEFFDLAIESKFSESETTRLLYGGHIEIDHETFVHC